VEHHSRHGSYPGTMDRRTEFIQNCRHGIQMTNPPFTGFHSHSQGRGQPYPGWQALPEDDNAWFPFDPRDPDGSGSPLMPGDYVVMRGALWQDTSHGGDPWETGSTVGHGGGSEIHPPRLHHSSRSTKVKCAIDGPRGSADHPFPECGPVHHRTRFRPLCAVTLLAGSACVG
jgi:hypothetical protein